MKNDIFGGFSAVAQSISDRVSPMDAGEEEEVVSQEEEVIPEKDTSIESNVEEEEDYIPFKEVPESEEGGEEKEEEEHPEDDPDLGSEFGEAEPDLAAYLQEKLFDGFGFEKGETEFQSIEEVVDFVKKVVDENSKPTYANEELGKIDEYVREGGDLKHYLELTKGGIDINNVDIESHTDQKDIIKEHFKTKGYSDAKISRAIERYEDAGVLREEAEDALEMLEEYKASVAEKLLEDKKNENAYMLEEQQKYVESVKQEIEGLTDVRGINLTKAEKQELFDYIFRPTKSGRTRYQEDYVKSQKNMIESAFFTMKGDTLVKKVQKKATSEAASRLKKKLANKGLRGRNQSSQGGSKVSNIWDMASSQLRSPF